jgi:branched-chain amino acid transport system permease protein
MYEKLRRSLHIPAAVVVLFALLTLANFTLNRYVLYIVTLMGVYIIATVSLNLTNGYSGLFSLGHAGFMAVGAYTCSLLTYPAQMRPLYALPRLPGILGGPSFQWPFLPALLVGGLFAAVLAIPVGFPVLRLRGHYLAVATLGFMVIVQTLATNLSDITRGALGINGIPHYTDIWVAYAWVVITIYVIWRLLNSSYGRALMAIREDETAAQVLAIDLTKYKLLSLTVGAFFAGVAGALFAHLTTAISPYDFSFTLTFDIVIFLIVGGSGTLTGSILGPVVLTALTFGLKPVEEGLGIYGLIEVIFALLLIITVTKRRGGLSGGKEISLKDLSARLLSYLRGAR